MTLANVKVSEDIPNEFRALTEQALSQWAPGSQLLTGYKLFHNHLAVDLVESTFEFGSRPFVELQEMIWLAVFSRAAEQHLAGLIFTFAYDSSVGSRFIDDAQRAVEPAGSSVANVALRCRTEVFCRGTRETHRAAFTARVREAKLRRAVSRVEGCGSLH